MSTSTNQNSYDELPYPSMPYPQTHPNRLASVASLLGMTPAPVDNCRVLELGCAGGGNLVPMALALPNSQFVGIDYSARQIAEGQEMIQALGVAGCGVGMRTRSLIRAPLRVSTRAPLIPDPPISIPMAIIVSSSVGFVRAGQGVGPRRSSRGQRTVP